MAAVVAFLFLASALLHLTFRSLNCQPTDQLLLKLADHLLSKSSSRVCDEGVVLLIWI